MHGTLAAIESVCATHTIEPDEALKAWRTQLEFEPSREYVEAMAIGLAALSKAHRTVDHEAYLAKMQGRPVFGENAFAKGMGNG